MVVDFFTGEARELPRGDSVVVVGSSGSIGKRGEFVDSHTLVIRMNNAPTKGFADRVGKRTDIRLVAHNAVKGIRPEHLPTNGVLVVWGTLEHYNKVAPMVARLARMGKCPIWRLSSAEMLENDVLFERETGVGRLSSGAWLSTGWFALTLAQRLTDGDVDAVGFGLSSGSPSAPYHYWERSGGNERQYMAGHQRATKGHRFFTEMEIFQRWERIKFS